MLEGVVVVTFQNWIDIHVEYDVEEDLVEAVVQGSSLQLLLLPVWDQKLMSKWNKIWWIFPVL